MPAEAKQIRRQAATAANQLIFQHDPQAIDRALSYCEHWLHLTNERDAHQMRAALIQRVERVQNLEQGLRRAMQAQPITGIVEALHDLASQPDRLSTTAGVIQEAEKALKERETDCVPSKANLTNCSRIQLT